jgi:hypothetical protein
MIKKNSTSFKTIKSLNRFRLKQVNGRHCLIDAKGILFFTLGVNHIEAIQEESEYPLFTEKYKNDWQEFSKVARDDLYRWSYNTAGYGAPHAIRPLMPYFADVFLERNSNFLSDEEFHYPDVFDPEIQAAKIAQLNKMCEQGDSENLIGYYWTDTPQWDLERALKTRGTNWVITIRELPLSAPGRIQYEAYLESSKEKGVPPSDEGFLRLIAREHYRLIGETTRKLSPHALIFGERYLLGDHPDCVLEEALPYLDVLSIQPGSDKFESEYFDTLYAKYQKPIIVCDHQCSFATPKYAQTMWHQLESEQAVAEMYCNYLKDMIQKSYIIGYHRCQYIDRYNAYPGVLKQGLLREDGSAYATLEAAVAMSNTATLETFSKETDTTKNDSD